MTYGYLTEEFDSLANPNRCVFHISLYDMLPSKAQHDQSHGPDSTLLDIFHSDPCDQENIFAGYGYVFASLFNDRSRAGQFYVDRGSWLALAKQIIQIIYPKYVT
jgi:hypothetical protein